MEYQDNYVRRLLNVVESAMKVADGANMWEGWSQTLNIHIGKWERLLQRYAQLTRLCQLAYDQAKAVEGINTDYLKWEPSVRAGLSIINSSTNFGAIKSQLNKDSCIALIKICDEKIQDKVNLRTVNEVALEELQREMEGHAKSIHESQMSNPPKDYLLTQLDRLISALNDFRYVGIPVLDEGLEGVVGSVWARHTEYKASRACEDGNQFWKKAERAAAIITIGTSPIQLSLMGRSAMNLLDQQVESAPSTVDISHSEATSTARDGGLPLVRDSNGANAH